jgi:hypothetical protein
MTTQPTRLVRSLRQLRCHARKGCQPAMFFVNTKR